MRLTIISGRSGSGKTIALHALEDMGFYCIDNLPISFLPDLQTHIGFRNESIAVSIDARNIPDDLSHFRDNIQKILDEGHFCQIIYLDADEKTLLKRFSETRRKHPLSNANTSLQEAIRKEHTLLTPIASLADLTIDTSSISRTVLQNLVRERFMHSNKTNQSKMHLLLQSFGFKHGIPPDADFVFDIRCLPNPYWESELRPLSGMDKPVIDFLESKPEVQAMIKDILKFLENWIPSFVADNRSYLTIAIGCTGGVHRSVYFVHKIAELIKNNITEIQIRHRELVNHISL